MHRLLGREAGRVALGRVAAALGVGLLVVGEEAVEDRRACGRATVRKRSRSTRSVPMPITRVRITGRSVRQRSARSVTGAVSRSTTWDLGEQVLAEGRLGLGDGVAQGA